MVTGAGRALGASLAFALAENNCRPILAGRNLEALERVSDSIDDNFGLRPCIVHVDLADATSIAVAVQKVQAEHDTIDILINNGATWLETSDGGYLAQDVLSSVNSAISGTFILTQGLLPNLRRSSRPDIVTIGSVSGLPNAALQTVSVPFYAAKRGQAGLAEGFAQMMAGTPIRSIVVHPPYLDDVAPCTPEWDLVPLREKGQRATNRDICEAVLFAIGRPRHITLSVTVDADDGGLHPAYRR